MSRRPLVLYIAGPFRGPTAWDVECNVRRAEEVALEAWRAGFAVICPHTNTRFFDGAAPDAIWLEGDKELLRRCDGVVLVEGWERSSGAVEEVNLATREQIPKFDDVAAATEWFTRIGLLAS